jgi:hypothetical protein
MKIRKDDHARLRTIFHKYPHCDAISHVWTRSHQPVPSVGRSVVG